MGEGGGGGSCSPAILKRVNHEMLHLAVEGGCRGKMRRRVGFEHQVEAIVLEMEMGYQANKVILVPRLGELKNGRKGLCRLWVKLYVSQCL